MRLNISNYTMSLQNLKSFDPTSNLIELLIVCIKMGRKFLMILLKVEQIQSIGGL